MMGSTGQQLDALSSILKLITDPDMVKDNIKALQAKMQQSEQSVLLAREEQKAAKDSVVEAAKTLAQVDDARNKLEADIKNHEDNKAKLEAFQSRIAVESDDLQAAITLHVADIKNHTDNVAKFQASIDNHQEHVGRAMAHIEARTDELDKRTLAVTKLEQDVAKMHEELKAKLETLKKLAS